MKCRTIIGGTFLMMLVVPVTGAAQTRSDDPILYPTVLPMDVKKFDFGPAPAASPPIKVKNDAKPLPPVRFQKKQFLILSVAVYGAAFADMHQTVKYRKYDWWYESDPLARPFVHLPSPAYYAAGFAMATGVNWISWKMGHSRRWHRFAAVPQLLAIAGNSYGYKVSQFSSTN